MSREDNRKLNELLVYLFNRVMDTEAKAVITEEYKDITNNDMHIIDAIGIGEPGSMSAIARQLSVTVGTLTVNMNSLEKKGYIKRERSAEDKRVVMVTITEKGIRAFFNHTEIHWAIISSAVKGLNEEEMKVLISCLQKLSNFFDKEDREYKE